MLALVLALVLASADVSLDLVSVESIKSLWVNDLPEINVPVILFLNDSTHVDPHVGSPIGAHLYLNTSALCIGAGGNDAGSSHLTNCATRFFSLGIHIEQVHTLSHLAPTDALPVHEVPAVHWVPLPASRIALNMRVETDPNDPFARTVAAETAYTNHSGILQVPPWEMSAGTYVVQVRQDDVSTGQGTFGHTTRVKLWVSLRRVALGSERGPTVFAHPFMRDAAPGSAAFDARFQDYALFAAPGPRNHQVQLVAHWSVVPELGTYYNECTALQEKFAKSLCLERRFFRAMAKRFAHTPFPSCFGFSQVAQGVLDECSLVSWTAGVEQRNNLHSVGDALSVCDMHRCGDGCVRGIISRWVSQQLESLAQQEPDRFEGDLRTSMIHEAALFEFGCQALLPRNVYLCYEAVGEGLVIATTGMGSDRKYMLSLAESLTMCEAFTQSETVSSAYQTERRARCYSGALHRRVQDELFEVAQDVPIDVVVNDVCQEGSLSSQHMDQKEVCFSAIGVAAGLRFDHDYATAKAEVCKQINKEKGDISACKDGLRSELARAGNETLVNQACDSSTLATYVSVVGLVHRPPGAVEDQGATQERQRDAFYLMDGPGYVLDWAQDATSNTKYMANSNRLSLPAEAKQEDAVAVDYYIVVDRNGAAMDVEVYINDFTEYAGQEVPSRTRFVDIGAKLAQLHGIDLPRPAPMPSPAAGAVPRPPTLPPVTIGPPTPPITASVEVTDDASAAEQDTGSPVAVLVLGVMIAVATLAGCSWYCYTLRQRKVVMA